MNHLKNKNNILKYFDGRIIFDKSTNKTVYYQDLKKKWKFYTDEVGLKLLLKCYKKIKLMLIENLDLIKKLNKNIKNTITPTDI
jgi:predicted RNA-binding protein with PUA domain